MFIQRWWFLNRDVSCVFETGMRSSCGLSGAGVWLEQLWGSLCKEPPIGRGQEREACQHRRVLPRQRWAWLSLCACSSRPHTLKRFPELNKNLFLVEIAEECQASGVGLDWQPQEASVLSRRWATVNLPPRNHP